MTAMVYIRGIVDSELQLRDGNASLEVVAEEYLRIQVHCSENMARWCKEHLRVGDHVEILATPQVGREVQAIKISSLEERLREDDRVYILAIPEIGYEVQAIKATLLEAET